jgi:hypothetical protein
MMPRCLRIFLVLVVAAMSMRATAQGKCPEIPKEYQWETPEDYRKDTDLVKKALKWLCSAPLNIDLSRRSEANIFVLKWLSGTPDYRIEIDTEKLDFLMAHPELMDTFIHGMSLAYLNKESQPNQVDAYAAGFQAVVQVASQSKSLSKSRHLKPMFRAARQNQMKKYTEKVLAKKR